MVGRLFYRKMKEIRFLTLSNNRDEFFLASNSDDPISELDVKQGATPSEDEDKGYVLIGKPATKSSPATVTISNLYNNPDKKLSLEIDGTNFKVIHG